MILTYIKYNRAKLHAIILGVFLFIYPLLNVLVDNTFCSIIRLPLFYTATVMAAILYALYLSDGIGCFKDLLKKLTPYTYFALIYILFAVIATVFSINPYVSFFGTSNKREGLTTVLCYLLISITSAVPYLQAYINRLIRVFVLSGLISTIIFILVRYGILYNIIDKLYINNERFFNNSNHTGIFFAIVLCFILIAFVFSKTKMQAAVYLFFGAFVYQALLINGSRGSLVAFVFAILALFIMLLITKADKKVIIKLAFITIFFALQFYLFSHIDKLSFVLNYKKTLRESGLNYGSQRLKIWIYSLPLIPKYFLHGAGLNTFSLIFPFEKLPLRANQPANVYDSSLISFHNEYLEMTVYMGIFAFLNWLCMLGNLLNKAFNNIKKKAPLQYGLAMVLICFLVKFFFNSGIYTVSPFFWIFAGLTAGSNMLNLLWLDGLLSMQHHNLRCVAHKKLIE